MISNLCLQSFLDLRCLISRQRRAQTRVYTKRHTGRQRDARIAAGFWWATGATKLYLFPSLLPLLHVARVCYCLPCTSPSPSSSLLLLLLLYRPAAPATAARQRGQHGRVPAAVNAGWGAARPEGADRPTRGSSRFGVLRRSFRPGFARVSQIFCSFGAPWVVPYNKPISLFFKWNKCQAFSFFFFSFFFCY